MDHLLEAYASSSSDDEKIEEKDPKPSVLGELPSELLTIFKDSGESLRITPSSILVTYACVKCWSNYVFRCGLSLLPTLM